MAPISSTSTSDKNIASHVAATVAAVLAILAYVQPGFHLPHGVTAGTVSIILAGLIELVNTYFHRSNAAKLVVVKALAAKAVAAAPTPEVNPPAPVSSGPAAAPDAPPPGP